MTRLFCILIVLSFLGIDSCKKDDPEPDYCTSSWYSTLSDEINVMTNAAMAYISNPNPTTCTAYKNAMQKYIDALEPFDKCTLWTAQDKEEWQSSINEARADLATACQ
jgi:hypothetical protein